MARNSASLSPRTFFFRQIYHVEQNCRFGFNFGVFVNCPQELPPFEATCFFLHSGFLQVDQLSRKIIISAVEKCVGGFNQFGIQCSEMWFTRAHQIERGS